MPTTISAKQRLEMPSQVRRVRGQPGDLYDLIFLDQQDRIIVPPTFVVSLAERTRADEHKKYVPCLPPVLLHVPRRERVSLNTVQIRITHQYEKQRLTWGPDQ